MTYKSYKNFGATNNGTNSDNEGVAENAAASGEIGKIEYNLPLDRDSYEHLVEKADGNVIRKKRYLIPLNEGAFEEEFLNKNEGLKRAL